MPIIALVATYSIPKHMRAKIVNGIERMIDFGAYSVFLVSISVQDCLQVEGAQAPEVLFFDKIIFSRSRSIIKLLFPGVKQLHNLFTTKDSTTLPFSFWLGFC